MSNDKTGIAWTDATWNPITGCSKISAGCTNCYAATLAPRLAGLGVPGYTTLPWTKPNARENVVLHPERLEKPLRWCKPRRVFVNSMSDLFHEEVPDGFIDRVFAVMALARQHTFQVLTKRPERMASYFGPSRRRDVTVAIAEMDVSRIPSAAVRNRHRTIRDWHEIGPPYDGALADWPLPNVWLGVSVENQAQAHRVDLLRRVPAAVRFLSCEPLLGPLSLDLTGIHWVIAGGESGRGYRPMREEWARGLRNQAVGRGVPFFFKQHSGLGAGSDPSLDGEEWRQFPESVLAGAAEAGGGRAW